MLLIKKMADHQQEGIIFVPIKTIQNILSDGIFSRRYIKFQKIGAEFKQTVAEQNFVVNSVEDLTYEDLKRVAVLNSVLTASCTNERCKKYVNFCDFHGKNTKTVLNTLEIAYTKLLKDQHTDPNLDNFIFHVENFMKKCTYYTDCIVIVDKCNYPIMEEEIRQFSHPLKGKFFVDSFEKACEVYTLLCLRNDKDAEKWLKLASSMLQKSI